MRRRLRDAGYYFPLVCFGKLLVAIAVVLIAFFGDGGAIADYVVSGDIETACLPVKWLAERQAS